jgi:hypothetical protein
MENEINHLEPEEYKAVVMVVDSVLNNEFAYKNYVRVLGRALIDIDRRIKRAEGRQNG